jgi:nucleotide-binding universal stress UspA family protein
MSVLIGFADTPEGRAALRRGLEEARLRDQPAHVVRSVRVEDPGAASVAARQSAHLRSEEERLAEIERHASTDGIDVATHLVLESQGEGQFLRDFSRIADEVDATLAVIGIRDRSRVGKFLLGSRAQDVLLHLDCDVLAVKATEDD